MWLCGCVCATGLVCEYVAYFEAVGTCSKSFSTSTPQCSSAGHRVKSVNMGPQLNKLRFMCVCVCSCVHMHACVLVS